MTPALVFLIQTLLIVALPPATLCCLRLRGLVPLVVVQIVLSIALGPSLLGHLLPELHQQLFEPVNMAPVQGIAAIAVLLFGFLTGLHLEMATFRGRGRAFALVATASLAVPVVVGIFGGVWIAARHPTELGPHVDMAEFAIAIGICMAVTALPVLGAILRETGLLDHRIGQLALGIAGVNDAGLWIGLSLLLAAVAGPTTAGLDLILKLTLLPIYLLAMALVVRPVIGKMATLLLREQRLGEGGLVIVCAVSIVSAAITEALGLHFILGAFIAGAVMPDVLRKPILDRLRLVTIAVLMPFFFMSVGLRTEINLGSPTFLEIFVVTTALGVIGKMGGTAAVARLVGESWRTALSLGALVQTKGLMEVIVLTILLDREIISTSVFSALMMMALASTALAMPMTRWLLAREYHDARDTLPNAPLPATASEGQERGDR